MSITTSEMTPADIAAVTNGGNSNGWGGDWSSWIIIFLIFAMFGGYGRGFGGFGGGSGDAGAANNYVLASDFATIQRQLSDGFGGVEKGIDTVRNGLCDGFYTEAQLINGVNTNIMQGNFGIQSAINGIGTQVADCCCKTQTAIAETNYNLANQANMLARQVERGFADTNYNMATQNCATLTAIDKVGDRVIDYLANKEAQNLRDENQALRLAASQQAQNAYLISQLGYQCPKPAYVVQPPQSVSFPTNCCGGVNYASYNGGCGCN